MTDQQHLLDAIASMQDHIARLEARIDELEGGDRAGASGGRYDIDGTVDRRSLLRRGGAVAAGAVAGGLALGAAAASPAAAANGDPLLLGTEINAASEATGARYAGETTGVAFLFQDGVFPAGSSFAPAVLAGWATGAGRTGVYAFTGPDAGDALLARSFGTTSVAAKLGCHPASAHLHLDPIGAAPDVRGGLYRRGSMLVDENGDLWYCYSPGSPGEWRRLAGTNTVAGLTILTSPVRVYDSRPGQNPVGVFKGKLATSTSRTIDLKVSAAVPEGASGALVNLTATNTSEAGFLKIYKAGAGVPSGSTLNWDHAGSNVANSATVALDSAESCNVRCGGTGASTDFIVDVVGYYT